MRGDRLEVLVKKFVLFAEILAPGWKSEVNIDGTQETLCAGTNLDCRSAISLSRASRCCCQLASELASLA